MQPEKTVEETMAELRELAVSVAEGKRTGVGVAQLVAEMCTRHGPGSVRLLDAFYRGVRRDARRQARKSKRTDDA